MPGGPAGCGAVLERLILVVLISITDHRPQLLFTVLLALFLHHEHQTD
jgi:hypothetical protein